MLTPAREAKRDALLSLLGRVRHLDGCIVELGVFRGQTLHALAEACPQKQCYGFDTFEGMPAEKCLPTDGHTAGEFCETDFAAVAAAMPPNVVLRMGVFPHTAEGLDVRVCFAHADFDLERSMSDAIAWLVPRMVPGGIVVFDDWNKKKMPGVDKAIARAGLKVTMATKHQGYWVAP